MRPIEASLLPEGLRGAEIVGVNEEHIIDFVRCILSPLWKWEVGAIHLPAKTILQGVEKEGEKTPKSLSPFPCARFLLKLQVLPSA